MTETEARETKVLPGDKEWSQAVRKGWSHWPCGQNTPVHLLLSLALIGYKSVT